MALSKEDYDELKKLLASGEDIDPALRSEAQASVAAYESAAPAAPGKTAPVDVRGTSLDDDPEVQFGQVATQMDPRFDLVPQALALQPATTHPGGDASFDEQWRVGNQGDWLDRWVHCQFVHASCAHGVDAGIVPDVCPMASMLAKFEVVDV